MQSFFSDPGGVGREVAINSLRRDIVGLIGGPARLHDALFLDAPFADFFASDDDGRLFIIRWIDSHDFASVFTRTLSEVVRLNETGRAVASRLFGLPDDFPPPTLVLVSDRMEEDWVRVVSALRLPVILLRAHSLVDGTRHSAGCLFERRYATPSSPARPVGRLRLATQAQSQPKAAPRSDAETITPRPTGIHGPAADLRLAAVDLEEPIESLDAIQPAEELEVLLLERLLGGEDRHTEPELGPELRPESEPDAEVDADLAARGDQASFGEQAAEGTSVLDEAANPDSAAPPMPLAPESLSEGATAAAGLAVDRRERTGTTLESWATPRALLTDEEAATFRLLESILQSRN